MKSLGFSRYVRLITLGPLIGLRINVLESGVSVGKEPEPPRRDKPGAWSLRFVAIGAGAKRRCRSAGCRYASAAATPIQDAMPAMLQSPHSNTARFRERRAEGQRRGGYLGARLTVAPVGPEKSP
jgi:hypothetical protein